MIAETVDTKVGYCVRHLRGGVAELIKKSAADRRVTERSGGLMGDQYKFPDNCIGKLKYILFVV